MCTTHTCVHMYVLYTHTVQLRTRGMRKTIRCVHNICTRGAGISDHDCVKRERTHGGRGGGGDEGEEEEEEMEMNGKDEKEKKEECGREDGGEGREGGSGW